MTRYFPVFRLQVVDPDPKGRDFFSEREVDQYFNLMKKLGIVDVLGQISYWDEDTLTVESARWFSASEINELLAKLKRTIYRDFIHFQIYEETPRGVYGKLVEEDRVTDIVLPILD